MRGGQLATQQTAQATPAGYVGDAACAECHQDIVERYRGHSMGRSLTPVLQADPLMQTEDDGSITRADHSFVAGGFQYEVLQRGDKVFHRQSRRTEDGGELAVIEQQVHYAIGAGHHGRAYLVNRDGYLFLSPVTWYPDKGIWDLSPGFEKNNSQFNRPVIESCLFCHSNRALRVPHTANRYPEPVFAGHSIGCERCHGPGEIHVQMQRDGRTGQPGAQEIVNPADLPPPLREAVCQQCHLSGVARVLRPGRSLYDFQPGQPLESCFSTFVARPGLAEGNQLVGHVEQMVESRCFVASDGKLGCISCHDPHGLPAPDVRIAFYRERCLRCHATHDCGLDEPTRRQSHPDDSCMACHMPRHDTEVRHVATVNHRIPRDASKPVSQTAAAVAERGAMPIVRFAGGSPPPGPDRDLAIALVIASDTLPEARRADLKQYAMRALEKYARDNSDDLAAYEYLGQAYLAAGRSREASDVYKHVLQRQPKREASLAVVADLFSAVGDYPRAIRYWQRAIEVNPWMSRYWYGLAKAYQGSGQWKLCQQTAEHAIRRFPTSMGARHLLVESHLRLGEPAGADEAFEWIRRYNPRGMDSLSKWYESHPLRP